MRQVIIASENQVKASAVKNAFQRMFPGESFEITGVSIPSDVNDQPMGDTETLRGAKNRVNHAAREHAADFFVGIENGIDESEDGMQNFARVVVRGSDGTIGTARSAGYFLPPRIAEIVRQGKTLEEAGDTVLGTTGIGHQKGIINHVTGAAVTRIDYLAEAVIFALLPFKNPDLYRTY